ncbi:Hypothetical predicted protein [Pelobates cultripes]|uniref:Uncharacterized protein n=1 Tax=Pelobates cultripes TaxID=61616 RepID=A0AAD1R2H6_PELCU|nr:Hypothetical predicted protein [Pelobates cultripes]
MATPDPPTGDQVRSKWRPGKPLMGTTTSHTPKTRSRHSPGLRALRVQTPKYQPHTRRTARHPRCRRIPDKCKAHRTTLTGTTLDLKGTQANGMKVQALLQLHDTALLP